MGSGSLRVAGVLVLSLFFPGCLRVESSACGRDASCIEVPDRWSMAPDVRVGPWPADGNVTLPSWLGLLVDQGEGGAFVARVTNGGSAPVVAGGSDCGLFVARPTPEGWRVFAAFAGNHAEVVLRIEPGASCATEGRLEARVGRALEPGGYRVAFLARVMEREDQHDGPVVLAWAPWVER